MKNLVILEDSSKVTFGGGQKGTLEIIDVLKDKFKLFLFDCSKNSIFQEKIQQFDKYLTKLDLKCKGELKGGENSSFSVGYKEVFLFPFFMFYNLFILLKFVKQYSLNKNNTIFYTSNKKHLLILFMLHKVSNIEYIFHARTYDDKNSKFYKLMIPALKNAKYNICVSDFIKQNIGYKNCITLYNPLKIDKKYYSFHKPKTLKKEIIIATASELLKWKGIEYFIKSYQYLPKEYNIKYYIYGKGKEEENLKKLAKSKNIIFKGFNNKLFEEFINIVDIIVVPSISPESFGRTSVEGSFFGVVPIASKLGGQIELLSKIDENLLFEPKNEKEIAKKIEYVIENYNNLSKKSVEFSDTLNYDNFKVKLNSIFGTF